MMRAAFELLHPAVPIAYFAALLVLAMAAMHPVYAALAWAGSLALCAGLSGGRAAGRALSWQLPVVALLAAANCLFVGSGSTELFRIGPRAFYAEALAYGACAGAVLVGVLQIFANASRALTSDKVLAVLGRAFPTVALMLSMTLRLVPQFARRGGVVRDAARACTAAAGARGAGGRRAGVRENLRLVSVLMGWGMEDALETADAMKARGWGAVHRRTTYERHRFRAADGCALAVVALLAAASAAAAWRACAQLTFYPTFGGLAPWYSYAPFALLAFLPALAAACVPGREGGGA